MSAKKRTPCIVHRTVYTLYMNRICNIHGTVQTPYIKPYIVPHRHRMHTARDVRSAPPSEYLLDL